MSLKGKKPVIFDCASNYRSYHSRTFEIDEDTKRYAYLASNGKLAYKFMQLKTGTIMMRAKAFGIGGTRQIFESDDGIGNKFGLYVDSNNKLIMKDNSTVVNTGLVFARNQWHAVGVSYSETRVSTGGYDIIYRVLLDNNVFEKTIHQNKLRTLGTTMIGRTFEGATVNECNAFRGHIETVATSKTFIDQNTFMSFANKLNCMTKITAFDEFNMCKGSKVLCNGVNILENDITYKSTNKTENEKPYKQLSHLVEKETITECGDLLTERTYTTDSFGRITQINDTLFGGHTYTYDKRGFLTSADSETYEYDANGNITKMGNTDLTYDSVMKDRLASVGGKAVSYATDSSICPTAWNGINYTFEGRRLVGYGVPLTKTNIAFAYNDRGLRTKKVVSKPNGSLVGGMTSTTTEYFYDGDKLIAEKRGENIRLDYLYDENGSLYGFVYNKTDKYFYVRDVLQNILGIIDSNGTLVVRYKYNAWGKKVLVQDATQIGIGEINPFRFKGYYYDTETGMYYCQSRYYVPEWGRWLCGDNPCYLNPSNLAEFNLFAYCANDPVNYIDPTGTSIFVLIGLLIGAAIGFGVATYKDYKDDGKVFNGSVSFWEYLGSTAIGAAIGGLIGAGIGHLLAPAAGMAGTAGIVSAGAGTMAMASVSVTDIVVAAAGAAAVAMASLGLIMFAKGDKPSNQYQNQQWAEAMRQLGIEKGDLWRRLHDEIHKYPYHDKLRDLLRTLRKILRKWGKL